MGGPHDSQRIRGGVLPYGCSTTIWSAQRTENSREGRFATRGSRARPPEGSCKAQRPPGTNARGSDTHGGPRAAPLTVSRETLEALAGRYGLPPATAEPLEALLAALAREADPPTTLRSPQDVLDGHIADSLSGLEVAELAGADRIGDIGAGAGFPGLALAAALPGAHVDLIESTARKAALIERLAAAAGLANASALPLRAEEWAASGGAEAYDAVTARAVAPIAVLAEYAAPLLRPGGALVAWKGSREPAEEAAGAAAAARLGLRPEKVLQVAPFERARDRHLHVYLKVEDTPPRFPRRVGVARKRPLA